jgi:hypothetical protein
VPALQSDGGFYGLWRGYPAGLFRSVPFRTTRCQRAGIGRTLAVTGDLDQRRIAGGQVSGRKERFMSTVLAGVEAAAIVTGWRQGIERGGQPNPAGPLFTNAYVEHDIAAAPAAVTRVSYITCLSPGGICCV